MSDHTVIPLSGARSPIGAMAGDARSTLHFEPHEHLYFQGDTPDGVHQILSGTVILYRLTADGRRQIQTFACEGDFLALCFGDEHDLSAEALTHVTTCYVPRSVFERALQADPDIRRAVFGLIDEMIVSAREQTMMLGLKSALERTASFLLFLEGRFAPDAEGYIPIRMSRSDIADYLGLTLETVSRMLNRLKHDGVIDLPRPDQFRMLETTRLHMLAGDVSEDGRYLVGEARGRRAV